MSIENELVSKFGASADKAEVISTLQHYMKIYDLSVDEIYIKWEQFSYHNKDKYAVNSYSDQILQEFKDYIQQQMEKKVNTSIVLNPSINSSIKKPKMLIPSTNSPSIFGLGIPNTPTLKKRRLEAGTPTEASKVSPSAANSTSILNTSPSVTTPTTATPANLKNASEPDKCLVTLNVDNVAKAEGIDFDNDSKVKISPFYDPKKYKFRTMRQSLLDTADVLDEQIDIFSEIIQKHYNLKPSDIGDPTFQQQSEVYTVGRIVPDSVNAEGPLNVDSLAIETSRSTGIGRRIRLNFEKIQNLSVFPGQIVALKGKNANGEYFVVEDILKIPYLNSPVSDSEMLQDSQITLNNQPMKVVVTAGSYTPANNLDFSNLEHFVDRINTSIKPHILIMFGPFLDITHQLISSGNIPDFPNLKQQPKTLDEVFIKVIAPILKRINPKIQVILIPSTKEVTSKHAAYPQDSLDRKYLSLPKNFKCFTNPSTFQLNEIFFGCSNNDIYKDLKEVTKGGNVFQRNRFDRVSEHILEQRRYYPVFPGGIRTRKVEGKNGKPVFEHIAGADLDLPYLGLTEFIGGIIPDVILIPSELTHFARVVQNVIMLNPGSFIRPNGGRGTYIEMSIEAPDMENEKMTKVNDVYLHNLWKRSRIDILTA
ncbi:DNA-directed DNA polymerase alpha subunit POL12 [Kluyveromyces lactis]|uniref:DNA polymerase alpha subunit B n=1 Tax=Kluyveromyces lactis (strain ATCC 8585 / CBS 2359 / DSM 70799 / NBRC 1267 / NRRL Y-1140 / WM37) TaxID=284590 RepID=Q6CVG1_KLULA|nr:uncharacterized protein KLLA0_B12309g [Kluyveromyces lactis]CAH02471.1 KLLA0B12309p [Kluyveromyces lactis]|eukprot:XP_452078.1 uncharacterized protein KLLA0_B12309g [Kluyveromyces lactis]